MSSKIFCFSELSRQLIREGHCVHFLARGNSMKPFIQPETAMLVENVPICDLIKGDVVLYSSSHPQVTAHRLIGFNQTAHEIELITAADNDTLGTSFVSQNHYIGKVTPATIEWGARHRFAGLLWYYLRPIRRLKRVTQTRLSSLIR